MTSFKFSDLDLDFLAHPATGDIVVATDDAAIKRSLKNLIRFKKGDKPFHPEIVSGVTDLLFEPATPITSIRIQQEITRVINRYEKRVILDDVGVNFESSGNSFIIDIKYTIRSTLRAGSFVFSLERLR